MYEDDADGIGVAGDVSADLVEGLWGNCSGRVPDELRVFVGIDGVQDDSAVEARDGLLRREVVLIPVRGTLVGVAPFVVITGDVVDFSECA